MVARLEALAGELLLPVAFCGGVLVGALLAHPTLAARLAGLLRP